MAILKATLFYATACAFALGFLSLIYLGAQIGDGFCSGNDGPPCLARP